MGDQLSHHAKVARAALQADPAHNTPELMKALSFWGKYPHLGVEDFERGLLELREAGLAREQYGFWELTPAGRAHD